MKQTPETYDPSRLPYRRGVGLCVFNRSGRVFIAERRDTAGAWQMPQGGVNKNEQPLLAAKRELKEEIGTDNATIIGVVPEILRYEFPDFLQFRHGIFRGKYRGQEQFWIAMFFQGDDSEINLSGEHDHEPPEFIRWRWEDLATTPDLIVPFKRPVYQRMVEAFLPLSKALADGKQPAEVAPDIAFRL